MSKYNMSRRLPPSENHKMVDCIGCLTYFPNRIPKRVYPDSKCSYCGTKIDINGCEEQNI